MPQRKYISPCCRAPSIMRATSLEEGVVILRCTKCAQLRIERLGRAANEGPRLRLVVNR